MIYITITLLVISSIFFVWFLLHDPGIIYPNIQISDANKYTDEPIKLFNKAELKRRMAHCNKILTRQLPIKYYFDAMGLKHI